MNSNSVVNGLLIERDGLAEKKNKTHESTHQTINDMYSVYICPAVNSYVSFSDGILLKHMNLI